MRRVKPFLCVICGETNRDMFYHQKSLCKLHYRTDRHNNRNIILNQYDCVVCHDPNVEHYHVYKKNRCKEHYNVRNDQLYVREEKKEEVAPKKIVIKKIYHEEPEVEEVEKEPDLNIKVEETKKETSPTRAVFLEKKSTNPIIRIRLNKE